ncbi:SgcJ/EcaC family oxidoreductase [Spirosoma sp. HMF4905]|uniref:SgcJ/EcaC family oxidoreductase n=1 Tax=Spirosoma arboris TaxID=2682092 RepID=A0A7K1SQB0_9BACT|nr:SgcJ/EcaC family oxidoreductase [Spirosoma arboris]MVM35883.1 SgcJ/EcaC family oxidoreductase [Spirosoma arboris]
MKINQLSLVLAALAAALLFTASCNSPAKEKPATAEELSKVNRDFVKALNARDATAAANCYAVDAIILPPGQPNVTGHEAIQKYWQGFLDGAGYVDGTVSTIATGSNGDLGYEIGTADLHLKGPDGKIMTEKIKYTIVLKRNAEGKWLQTYDMWNPVAEPMAK